MPYVDMWRERVWGLSAAAVVDGYLHRASNEWACFDSRPIPSVTESLGPVAHLEFTIDLVHGIRAAVQSDMKKKSDAYSSRYMRTK
jgi:hypothetical protein